MYGLVPPVGVTAAWPVESPLQLTFDEMRRTSSGPVQSIMDHFLTKIAEVDLPPPEEIEIGTGATFLEQLISTLPQYGGGGGSKSNVKLGRALKD